ncbi:MAG: O-antigen ligase family protein, partial [Sedimentibacter sp.]|uniref:O-antigen ligase family protein n=1 Tax=Sedimentibacter sp. TaxID=1960295 RepID=UPI002980C744
FLKHKISIQKYNRYYIPMAIYALFVVLSTFMSLYRNVALLGFADMYQGMSVLLCYVLLTFIIMNFVNTERDVKIIIYSFVILGIIVGILGLSQYFGYDFLQTEVGKHLITPKSLEDANIEFTFGKYTIYATMYNTNFVGSFGALLLPITVMLYLNSGEKKKDFIFFISSVLTYTTWLGCNSRAGYIGIMVAGIIGIVMFRNVLKEKYKKICLLIIIYIIIAIAFNIASNGRVFGQFSRLSPLLEAEKLKTIQEGQKVRFEEVSVKNNTFTIKTTGEEIKGTVVNCEVTFEDGEGNILDILKDTNDYITFRDERYRDYSFRHTDGFPFINAKIYNRPLNLYAMEDDTVKVISMNMKLTEPVTAPRIKLFDGRETFASNRGYIWSRTLPMLKNTLFIGYGPDNYCLMFPQEDYVGRFNTGKSMTNIVVDKPHNMYMQTAVNTGAISLISLIFIWVTYLIGSFKLYSRKKIHTLLEYMGASAFLSVTAYLAAGIFNDNIVSVAPLFWIILGLGIGINKMNKIDIYTLQC